MEKCVWILFSFSFRLFFLCRRSLRSLLSPGCIKVKSVRHFGERSTWQMWKWLNKKILNLSLPSLLFCVRRLGGGGKRATCMTMTTAVLIWILSLACGIPALLGSNVKVRYVKPITSCKSFCSSQLISGQHFSYIAIRRRRFTPIRFN